MKSTNPTLSMATPAMTASSFIPPPSSREVNATISKNTPPSEEQVVAGVPISKKQHTTRALQSSSVRIQHKAAVPVPRFSSGAGVTVSTTIYKPPASLSLHRPRIPVVFPVQPPELPPLTPPRWEVPFLAPILLSETNLRSFTDGEDTVETSSHGEVSTSHSCSVLARDIATLLALDMCRVFLTKGVPQVWIRRTLCRRRQEAHYLYHDQLPYISAESHKQRRSSCQTPPTNDFVIRGIPNYGQTCFLNCVLQALASLSPLLVYLERIVQLHNQRLDDVVIPQTCLSEHLWQLLQALQHESLEPVDPRVILKKVGHEHSQFRPRHGTIWEQQDAQELLQALLGIVIGDGQLDKIGSLESSILSSCDEEEFLSLSAFLLRMNTEQEKRVESLSPQSAKEESSGGHHHPSVAHKDAELEEKKQEDFEREMQYSNGESTTKVQEPSSFTGGIHTIPTQDSEINSSSNSSKRHPPLSASTLLMLETLSPITPSPLSGWLGSTLQCCNCHHVRPIQNAPFLDIPIVPSSVSRHLSGKPGRLLSSRLPACTLQECLKEFTSVERVQDVECRNCTIQQDMTVLEEEVFMLRGAVETILSRSGSEHVKGLQLELAQAESRLEMLKSINPDEGEMQDLLSSFDLGGIMNEPRKLFLKRGEAHKCLMFTRLPNVLCLHVQRRYYDPATDRMAKTMQHVDFPEVLDLSPYCAYGGGKEGMSPWAGRGSGSSMADDGNTQKAVQLYKLMSVIEHCGNAFGGHYQTYRRVRSGGLDQWVLISDQSVSPIHWRDVRRCQAYMLFYESL